MRDQHMNPSDAVKALADCGAQTALAHHHGTFQLTDEAIDAPVIALGEALDEAKIPRERFAALKPGQVGGDRASPDPPAENLPDNLPVRLVLDRYVIPDPGERNVGLRAAKLLQRGRGDLGRRRHAGGGGQHPMGAGEIAAKTNGGARQLDRLLVIASDVLGEAGRAIIERQERIARA